LGFLGRAVPEAEAVVSGLQDVAVVGKPVEESGGHLGISEDSSPLTEAEIGGDDDAGLLVQLERSSFILFVPLMVTTNERGGVVARWCGGP